MLGNVRTFAEKGSALAGLVNWASETKPVRMLNEAVFGSDQRRTLPALSRRTFASRVKDRSIAEYRTYSKVRRQPSFSRHLRRPYSHAHDPVADARSAQVDEQSKQQVLTALGLPPRQ